MCRAIRVLLFVLLSARCGAQVDVSAGIGLGYPLLFPNAHTMLNSGEISADLHLGVTLHPVDALFFPSLIFSYGGERLPLQEAGQLVAIFRYRDAVLMFKEHYAIPGSPLTVHGGIGIALLSEKGVAPNNGPWVNTVIDSGNANKVFPAINIGVAYTRGQSSEHRCYVALGFDLQYLVLPAGGNTYAITVTGTGSNTTNYHASLSGSLVVPCIYVALHFKARK